MVRQGRFCGKTMIATNAGATDAGPKRRCRRLIPCSRPAFTDSAADGQQAGAGKANPTAPRRRTPRFCRLLDLRAKASSYGDTESSEENCYRV